MRSEFSAQKFTHTLLFLESTHTQLAIAIIPVSVETKSVTSRCHIVDWVHRHGYTLYSSVQLSGLHLSFLCRTTQLACFSFIGPHRFTLLHTNTKMWWVWQWFLLQFWTVELIVCFQDSDWLKKFGHIISGRFLLLIIISAGSSHDNRKVL